MSRKRIFINYSTGLFILFLLAGCKARNVDRPVGILGAFSDEIKLLEDSLRDKEEAVIGGISFTKGTLSGKEVVIAYTGIGKVNAAMTTTLLLEFYQPSQVIFTGIAGGINPDLAPGDLLVSERCVHHDLNYIFDDTLISYQPANPIDGMTNPVYFYADSLLLDLTRKMDRKLGLLPVITASDTIDPKILFGTIATGDAFIASGKKNIELIRRFQADAVEMEGAAVAQICYQREIPFILIRSISDAANENAVEDIEIFYRTAAKNANIMVMELLRQL